MFGGPSEATAPRPVPDPADWPKAVPLPKPRVAELPATGKKPLVASVVAERRFAIGKVDGFSRNEWTNQRRCRVDRRD